MTSALSSASGDGHGEMTVLTAPNVTIAVTIDLVARFHHRLGVGAGGRTGDTA